MSATGTHCNTPQHTATHRNTLQHTVTHGNARQHTATHGNTRQHTATHCNTLRRLLQRISPEQNVSCPSRKRVMSHIFDGCVSCVSRVTRDTCDMRLICVTKALQKILPKNTEALSGGRSHVTHINESCHEHQRVTCHARDQVHFTCKCVMSHVRMSHVAHVLRMIWGGYD